MNTLTSSSAGSRRPNLVFIMTDQQRYDALGVNGNQTVQTPAMDALARSGANLHEFFSCSPVCVPSRCNLFTGRYPHSHRVRENHALLECNREIHLFRALKQEGYALAYVGKNHLLEKRELENFDRVDETCDEDDPALRDWYAHELKQAADAGQPEIWRAGRFHDFPDHMTRTGKTAAAGLRYLQEREPDRPFCLCVSFCDPHVPHLAPRRFESVYRPESLALHPWSEGELAAKPSRYHMKWRAQKSDRADDAGRRHYLAVYLAMISFVDEKVGHLLAALERAGLDEDTIVVFTSDHGDFCFEHNLAKKDLVLSDSLLHVPFLIRWPGRIRRQDVRDTMIEQVDVMPTLLDLLGIEKPFGIQGKSFAPLLLGQTHTHKDAVFGEICPPWLHNPYPDYESIEQAAGSWARVGFNVIGDYNKSIRERDWRYCWYGNGEEELYDRRSDPHELVNLAKDPGCAADKMRLKLRLLEWCALTEDPLDPLTIRHLQINYDKWKGAEPLPGALDGPGWLQQRFTADLRKP